MAKLCLILRCKGISRALVLLWPYQGGTNPVSNRYQTGCNLLCKHSIFYKSACCHISRKNERCTRYELIMKPKFQQYLGTISPTLGRKSWTYHGLMLVACWSYSELISTRYSFLSYPDIAINSLLARTRLYERCMN